jgi:hypothetical protein
MANFGLVLLAGLLFGFLTTEVQAPKDFPDMRPMIPDAESLLDDFRDARTRPQIVQVASPQRSGQQDSDQFLPLRLVQTRFAAGRILDGQGIQPARANRCFPALHRRQTDLASFRYFGKLPPLQKQFSANPSAYSQFCCCSSASHA